MSYLLHHSYVFLSDNHDCILCFIQGSFIIMNRSRTTEMKYFFGFVFIILHPSSGKFFIDLLTLRHKSMQISNFIQQIIYS